MKRSKAFAIFVVTIVAAGVALSGALALAQQGHPGMGPGMGMGPETTEPGSDQGGGQGGGMMGGGMMDGGMMGKGMMPGGENSDAAP